VLDDTLDRRTLSLSQSGQVAEYEMIYTVYYQLIKQGEVSAQQQVEVYRDYQDDPNFALAKTREREVLVQEMREEAARLLLRQTIAYLTE
jgi:LPS-assembly lipoprotein